MNKRLRDKKYKEKLLNGILDDLGYLQDEKSNTIDLWFEADADKEFYQEYRISSVLSEEDMRKFDDEHRNLCKSLEAMSEILIKELKKRNLEHKRDCKRSWGYAISHNRMGDL